MFSCLVFVSFLRVPYTHDKTGSAETITLNFTISIEFSGGQEKYYGEKIEQKVIRNYIQPERNRKIGNGTQETE
ncbi:hypothetical protein D5282_13530 [bacterium 1xD8-48]|nr:hypothetical protein [bacterium 1xD8-48]